ncbi:hypothetical protein [Methylococcus sp. EFPC2]|uniref:hypothetical protein n=1 Tax=Methylococcus sp. EFPC2 TaxID=2812648 RepID=UPI001967EB1B|nr:hypothetical protein [Methylococcus sp. EFPC2]QSA99207.1 hypothetical protein JWZ97_01950 [Methylococcus sp. EFPC2]
MLMLDGPCELGCRQYTQSVSRFAGRGRLFTEKQLVYHARSFFKQKQTAMRELNPLYNLIKDLRARQEGLRGYL